MLHVLKKWWSRAIIKTFFLPNPQTDVRGIATGLWKKWWTNLLFRGRVWKLIPEAKNFLWSNNRTFFKNWNRGFLNRKNGGTVFVETWSHMTSKIFGEVLHLQIVVSIRGVTAEEIIVSVLYMIIHILFSNNFRKTCFIISLPIFAEECTFYFLYEEWRLLFRKRDGAMWPWFI